MNKTGRDGSAAEGIKPRPTDIAVFVGYTERAGASDAEELILQPTLVRSIQEYERLFGCPCFMPISIAAQTDAAGRHTLQIAAELKPVYLLYYAVKLFFHNGGRSCYIVSVGVYRPVPTIDLRGDSTLSRSTGFGLLDGIEVASLIGEASLLLIPEAVGLSDENYAALGCSVLEQCHRLSKRFVLLDLREGDRPMDAELHARTLAALGRNWLENAAAHYPFVRALLPPIYRESGGTSNVRVSLNGAPSVDLALLSKHAPALHQHISKALLQQTLTLPASAAIAGLLAANDLERGVWRPGIDRPLNSVVDTAVAIDEAMEHRLSRQAGNPAINVLRQVPTQGVRTLSSLTLAGNSSDWRLIPTRRLLLSINESINEGTRWVASAANDAVTWARVRDTVEAYLESLWKSGALRGARTDEAYQVRCGLGATIRPRDLRERRLHLEVDVALLAPRRFVSLRISHSTAG